MDPSPTTRQSTDFDVNLMHLGKIMLREVVAAHETPTIPLSGSINIPRAIQTKKTCMLTNQEDISMIS
jgi:hypothetical protein